MPMAPGLRSTRRTTTRYVTALELNGKVSTAPYLPESLVLHGGRLHETVSKTPDPKWGSAAGDAPPSFSTRR